uniref:Small ribosomal subunit protein uS8c n=2 Tax=Botryococcus braunii TaxID=38881 RepID=A0A097KQB0_BOTBR|nr:ribosomal protein S8 [Botryococcus braunii]AIT95373.1 ribosomal protein S8 [Botryococcus braunii]
MISLTEAMRFIFFTMVNDIISDTITRIRNASLVKSQTVFIPYTLLSEQISQILEKEGFIDSFQRHSKEKLLLFLKYKGTDKKPCITNLRRISKPGLRIYSAHKDIPRVLNGMGIVIISTAKGVLTDREARLQGLGGELLCSVW